MPAPTRAHARMGQDLAELPLPPRAPLMVVVLPIDISSERPRSMADGGALELEPMPPLVPKTYAEAEARRLRC